MIPSPAVYPHLTIVKSTRRVYHFAQNSYSGQFLFRPKEQA